MATTLTLTATRRFTGLNTTEQLHIVTTGATLEEAGQKMAREIESVDPKHFEANPGFCTEDSGGYTYWNDRLKELDELAAEEGTYPVWESGDKEEGDDPDLYLHTAPLPATVENLTAFADESLALHDLRITAN